MFTALASVLLAVPVLAGCGSSNPTIKTRNIEIQVAPNANNDAPLAVDIVLAYDPQLLGQLSELSASDWFRKRGQILLAFPTETNVRSFEVIPGQQALRYAVPSRASDAIGAFVFVGYDRQGSFRARIDTLSSLIVKLGEEDFAIESRP